MVIIDKEKCGGCGTCVDICHESCMYLVEGKVQINYDFCSTCTQCVAVCPSLALSWKGNEAEKFNKDIFPSSEQMDEFLKQRRTNRYFKDEKPARELIEEVINYGAYAPTHSHDFRVVVLDNTEILNEVDKVIFSYNKKIYKYLYKPKIILRLLKLFTPSSEAEYLRAKPKLERSMKSGKGYYCMPPVIIFIICLKRTPLALESAQYILYNMDLFARTKGLGCRNLVGNQMFFNRSNKMRKLLNMKKEEKIFAVLGIGYPSKKYRNKVSGKTLDIIWSN